MSEWFEIESQDDVELSEDGKTIEILFNTNKNGNQYVDVPIEFIKHIVDVIESRELIEYTEHLESRLKQYERADKIMAALNGES